METKKCGDCIHADVCAINEYLPEFSRENNAVGCLAFTDNRNFVEVVRCKDCKHREKSKWCDGYRCGNPYDGMASGVELKDDDFCSYGERRTDNREKTNYCPNCGAKIDGDGNEIDNG